MPKKLWLGGINGYLKTKRNLKNVNLYGCDKRYEEVYWIYWFKLYLS